MIGLAIQRFGLVTGLGFNAPASLAALRAGISAVRRTNWLDHETGEPLRGAIVPLPQWWEGIGKLADLAAPAINECLSTLTPGRAARTPILIGVAAAQRPGRFPNLDAQLLPEIQARLGWPMHPASRLFAADQTGCFHALQVAAALIDMGHAEHVVVAGVDSLLQHDTLDVLQQHRRLMTGSNSNGFFPGEAGGAVLVGRKGTSGASELCILGAGDAVESARIDSDEPFRAQGMTQAVKTALASAGVGLKDIAYRLTDLSGEHYKFKEAAFVAGRLNGGVRTMPLDLWHPIEYLGEIGAAILPCLLAQAAHAAVYRYAPGALALCHIGSDAGERAALVLGLQTTQVH